MRYRLSTLLVAIVWVGLVCGALRSPSYLWSGVAFALVVLALLTSILVVIYRTGPSRAMAIGFLIFTLGYLLVERGYWPAGPHGMSLPTQSLVSWSFAAVHGDLSAMPAQVGWERRMSYNSICVNSSAIVVGMAGGIIARMLCITRTADRQEPPPAHS